jgi:uncharacterized SAM-binding protein YcdF (DUF218 family)
MNSEKILVIHGNTNQGYELSSDSLDRVKVAIKLLQAEGFGKVIVTGGLFQESQKGVTIADAMKKYLTEKISVPIETEPESLTTIHNVELLREKVKNDSIVVVTSDYHAFRTRIIWRLIGRKKTSVISAPSSLKISFRKKAVEILGIIVSLLYWSNIKYPEIYFREKARTL